MMEIPCCPISPPTNPMLVDKVLEVLFSFFTITDVKKHRMVCNVWAKIGLYWLLERTSIELDISHNQRSLKDFLYALHYENITPPRNIVLNMYSYEGDSYWVYPDMAILYEELFVPYGNTIQCIHFRGWCDLNSDFIPKLLGIPACLKHLAFLCVPSHSTNISTSRIKWPTLRHLINLEMYGDSQMSDYFLESILRSVPNVKRLKFRNLCRQFIPRLCSHLIKVCTGQLDELILTEAHKIDQQSVDAIANSQLKLKHLSITGTRMHFDIDYRLLCRKLSTTLENLQIYCNRELVSDQHITLNVQSLRMNKLVQLRLTYCKLADRYTWKLSIMQLLPALNTLKIDVEAVSTRNLEREMIRNDEGLLERNWNRITINCMFCTHDALRRLDLPDSPFIHYDNFSFGIFLSKLPNLDFLTLAADSIALRNIIRHSRNLKELILTQSSVLTDSDVTGIPTQIMSELYEQQLHGPIHGTSEGIQSLTKLARFSINGENGLITNKAIQFGLAHSQSITSYIFEKCNIDDHNFDKLRGKGAAVVIKRRHFPSDSDTD